MNKWSNYYLQGLKKEEQFAKLLVNTFGGTIKHSSTQDDIYNHIDLIWTINNKDVYFDVKGLKKTNRSDTNVDDSIHWIEIQNVYGKLGWLYGKSDYIVFETLNNWLIVKRIDLITLIDNKVLNKSISNTKELYTFYQRYRRNDIIVKVLTSDLRNIAKKIIQK